MNEFKILEDYEFFEVLNEFPILTKTLEKLHINSNELKEGESIDDFFERKHLKLDEKRICLRKINFDIRYYLKKGNLPNSNIKINNNLDGEEEE